MKDHICKVAAVVLGVILVYTMSTENQRLEARVIGVTAQCSDGAFTTANRASGVCSAHGGVKRWIESK